MAALIQEPADRPGMRVSLRAAHGDIDVSAIARQVLRRRAPAGGGLLEPGHRPRDHRVHPQRVRRRPQRRRSQCRRGGSSRRGSCSSTSRRGRRPSRSCKRLRAQTGARAGHAGTLDPFATGLLLVLLGRATRLAQYLVGLDKRYETVDRPALDDGVRRPAGRAARGARRRSRADELERAARRAARRGGAARSGRLGRQDRRRARLQAGAARGGGGDAGPDEHRPRARAAGLRATASRGSRCASAPGRTCARSRTRSAATASSCAARRSGRSGRGRGRRSGCSRRSTSLPFLPLKELDDGRGGGDAQRARDRGAGARACCASPTTARSSPIGRGDGDADPPGDGAAVNVAHAPHELEAQPRAVAIGSFDGVHRGHAARRRTRSSRRGSPRRS